MGVAHGADDGETIISVGQVQVLEVERVNALGSCALAVRSQQRLPRTHPVRALPVAYCRQRRPQPLLFGFRNKTVVQIL